MSFTDCLDFECEHLKKGNVTTGGDDICSLNGTPVWDVCAKDCPKMQESDLSSEEDVDAAGFNMAFFVSDFELFVDLFEERVSAPSDEAGIQRVEAMIRERCR